jgi:hypothetical protein
MDELEHQASVGERRLPLKVERMQTRDERGSGGPFILNSIIDHRLQEPETTGSSAA